MADDRPTIVPIDPATGEALEPVPVTSREEIDRAVEASRAAQASWAATDVHTRADALRAFAAELTSDETLDALARTISGEMGKPVAEARGEVASVAPRLEGFIARAIEACEDQTTAEGNIEVTVGWRPLGVVGVIAPWNYPISTPNNLVVSALLTGNGVVLKPSELTPHTGARYHEVLSRHLPTGLVGLVQGAGEVGAGLVASRVDMIAFTGSVATGQRIMQAGAESMKRLVLEMGGKDPMIVLEGADIEKAAAHAARESTRNAGQVCVAVERVFVQRSIEPAFVQAVARELERVKMGDPSDAETTMGPMSSGRQRDLVLAQLDDARRRGAHFVVEGASRGPGFYLSPTLLSGVSDDMAIAREETFGPVVTVSTFDEADEAVRRANATPFGLGASVWGPAGPELEAIADRVEAGMVGVNRGLSAAGGAPWVGWKMSGFGYTRSTAGMRNFMLPKTRARAR